MGVLVQMQHTNIMVASLGNQLIGSQSMVGWVAPGRLLADQFGSLRTRAASLMDFTKSLRMIMETCKLTRWIHVQIRRFHLPTCITHPPREQLREMAHLLLLVK